MTTTIQRLEANKVSPGDPEEVARAMSEAGVSDEVGKFVAGIMALVAEGHAVSAVADDTRLTTNEAAKLLGVSRPTLIRYLDEGRIPFTSTGRDRRILASHVLAYINERDRQSRLLAEARANRLSIEEQVAAELGLSRSEAEELGIL